MRYSFPHSSIRLLALLLLLCSGLAAVGASAGVALSHTGEIKPSLSQLDLVAGQPSLAISRVDGGANTEPMDDAPQWFAATHSLGFCGASTPAPLSCQAHASVVAAAGRAQLPRAPPIPES